MTNKSGLQPTAPRYLAGQARQMYESLVPLLIERGTTNLSKSTVELYSQTWQISRTAYDSVIKEGTIVDGKKNPNVSVYENSVKNLRSLANDLGLTPASLVQIQKLIIESDSSADDAGLSFKERVDKIKF